MYGLSSIKREAQQEILSLLHTCCDIDHLFPGLQKVFQTVSRQIVWADPIVVSLDKTIHHMEFYYHDPVTQSEKAIVFKQANEFQYLFRELNHWNLNDEISENEEIARQLIAWSALSEPKTIREIMFLIRAGFWKFDPKQIPKLSGTPPADLEELISWDEKSVLTGTNIQNMDVISREAWSRIVAREQWYNDGGS
ncbi:hypothetical protein CA11_03370 [Gimesia maris]|uniref:hypothetical protein n=1 Tax=Gimesia maris TaxID=122 RepID=UPI00118C28AC|nr:hypothetical protein [Gimesia maris]QDU12558.1 hypothetical protein CA11_03370 [Gimesia maris]